MHCFKLMPESLAARAAAWTGWTGWALQGDLTAAVGGVDHVQSLCLSSWGLRRRHTQPVIMMEPCSSSSQSEALQLLVSFQCPSVYFQLDTLELHNELLCSYHCLPTSHALAQAKDTVVICILLLLHLCTWRLNVQQEVLAGCRPSVTTRGWQTAGKVAGIKKKIQRETPLIVLEVFISLLLEWFFLNEQRTFQIVTSSLYYCVITASGSSNSMM